VVHGRERPQHHPQEAHELSDVSQPPRGRIRGIDHVALAIPPCPKGETQQLAVAFYGDVLGLRRVPKPAGAGSPADCWFEASGGVGVHLVVEEAFAPARTAHPALLVDDLDAVLQRVTETGGQALRVGVPGGPSDNGEPDTPLPRRAVVDDPFGNRIELVERTELTPEMFEVLANHSIYPIHMLDEEGTIRWAGVSHEEFFGHRPEDMVGRHFRHFIGPAALEATLQGFANLGEIGEPTPWGGLAFPTELRAADGSLVACEVAALPTHRSGLPWHVLFTRQAGYERALDHAVEAMASGAGLGELLTLVVTAVSEVIPDAAVAIGHRWDGEGFAVTAGPAGDLLDGHPDAPWTRALARNEPEFVGDRNELPGPLAALARADGYEACWVHPVAMETDQAPTAAVVVWRTVPGGPNVFLRDNLRRASQLFRLTLQWDRSHRALEFAATHDPLTGLVNRQTFHDRVAAVSQARAGHAAVLYLDLDYFKPVNDRLGHQAGDRTLVVVAERLVTTLRPGDMVARIGGDEFAVLCERLATADDAEAVAGRLLEAIQAPITGVATETVHVDVSIGVADLRPGETVDAVLSRADESMRTAKRSGRGCWVRQSG
jgi:diguanylate cyclase (GGDEF)-like protein/PAS domain S-box-containing protein